jgi:hypothetical protein
MNTKLTLQLDEELIAKAQRYSDRSGKSISQLVADYFALIGADPEEAVKLTPRVRSLVGKLKGVKNPEATYRRNQERKSR